jgi:glucose/arabinose dehydrogenase
MRKSIVASLMISATFISATFWAASDAGAQSQTPPVLTGAAAYGDWRNDAPGVRRHITVGDLPAPYASRSASNTSSVVDPPRGAALKVPPDFTVTEFASGLDTPRLLRIAPNGDIFLAETGAGQVRVMRAADGALKPERNEIFAGDLDLPFGIAFYPPGPDPQFVYVASTDRVVRFPYRNGDLKAQGPAETMIPSLPRGGHWTRDIAFSPDGKRLYVSVGSGSNVAQSMSVKRGALLQSWEATHGLGAAWDSEARRADVLQFDSEGKNERSYAAGIRNCSGLAVQPGNGPGSGTVWCSTNERDGLGDNLPPDYVTRVKEGGFYGWPWYYIGGNEDPRHAGERSDLKGKAIVPDVLLQPHSAPLQMAFYDAPATAPGLFPAEYRGDVFVAAHGSWNRAKRTGYKIIRIHLQNGVPTGEYQDFVTGFVIDDERVWGRPVGVAAAHDGALLFSEDGNGTIWRVARTAAE